MNIPSILTSVIISYGTTTSLFHVLPYVSDRIGLGWVLTCIFICLSFMTAWSLISVGKSNPGFVDIPTTTLASPTFICAKENKFCSSCAQAKPARAHHCRRCNKCVFRMDHHCVWINNCVGYGNQKYFIQLLAYGLATSSFSLLLQFWKLYLWWSKLGVSFHDVLLGILNVSIIIVLRGFYSDQLESIETNTTLIETYKNKRGSSDTDVFGQIFGTSMLLWLLPVNSTAAPNYDEVAIPVDAIDDSVSSITAADTIQSLGIDDEESTAHELALDSLRESGRLKLD